VGGLGLGEASLGVAAVVVGVWWVWGVVWVVLMALVWVPFRESDRVIGPGVSVVLEFMIYRWLCG
jgi:hypothetical protein